MDTLIEALTAIQERRRLSTKQMADRLGYHINHWNKLRSGRYPVNDKFRMKALTAFPELAGLFYPNMRLLPAFMLAY
jgi:transcriptional regulator with XRE-family HTH domain